MPALATPRETTLLDREVLATGDEVQVTVLRLELATEGEAGVGISQLAPRARQQLHLSWRGRSERPRSPQRKSLLRSRSNHIANSVNCDPKSNSSATSTTVAGGIGLPRIRSTTSAIPSPSPARNIAIPNT